MDVYKLPPMSQFSQLRSAVPTRRDYCGDEMGRPTYSWNLGRNNCPSPQRQKMKKSGVWRDARESGGGVFSGPRHRHSTTIELALRVALSLWVGVPTSSVLSWDLRELPGLRLAPLPWGLAVLLPPGGEGIFSQEKSPCHHI